MIKVYHAITPRWDTGGPVDPTDPTDFAHVATVDSEVHEVFRLTNSVSCGWWENEGVTAHTEASTFREHKGARGTRSTSVGDLIVLDDGRVLRCAPFGWDEVSVTS
jgi:hypothetical protein